MVGRLRLGSPSQLLIYLKEIATNFKEQGNEYFKGKRYREAAGFYTQGIDAKPTDKVLLEALLCNRAACNLELRGLPNASRTRTLLMLGQRTTDLYSVTAQKQ